MKRFIATTALFGTLAAASPAAAHSHLVKAVPGVGSTISAAPREIALSFSEAVVPAFTGLALTDAKGAAVATGKAAGTGADIVVPVSGALPPGVYTVRWHAVSVDTHKTQGSFHFTVAP